MIQPFNFIFSFHNIGHKKGAACGFGEEIQTQDLNTYNNNINDVITQTQNYLSLPRNNKQTVLRGK